VYHGLNAEVLTTRQECYGQAIMTTTFAFTR